MMRQSTLDMEDLRKRRSLVITRKEAAEALGVDPRTITTSINEGTIPSVRLGRRVVIPREKFLALFATTPRAASPERPPGAGVPIRHRRALGTVRVPR